MLCIYDFLRNMRPTKLICVDIKKKVFTAYCKRGGVKHENIIHYQVPGRIWCNLEWQPNVVRIQLNNERRKKKNNRARASALFSLKRLKGTSPQGRMNVNAGREICNHLNKRRERREKTLPVTTLKTFRFTFTNTHRGIKFHCHLRFLSIRFSISRIFGY